VETGVKPIRHPVPGPLSVFNILKTERHEPVAYTEKRTLPLDRGGAKCAANQGLNRHCVFMFSRVDLLSGTLKARKGSSRARLAGE
jgi:hypothetical protein